MFNTHLSDLTNLEKHIHLIIAVDYKPEFTKDNSPFSNIQVICFKAGLILSAYTSGDRVDNIILVFSVDLFIKPVRLIAKCTRNFR